MPAQPSQRDVNHDVGAGGVRGSVQCAPSARHCLRLLRHHFSVAVVDGGIQLGLGTAKLSGEVGFDQCRQPVEAPLLLHGYRHGVGGAAGRIDGLGLSGADRVWVGQSIWSTLLHC